MMIKPTRLIDARPVASTNRVAGAGRFPRAAGINGAAVALWLVLIAVAPVGAEHGPNAAATDSSVIEQAQRGWLEYIKRTQSLQEDVTHTETDLDTNEITRSRNSKCRQIGNDMRLYAYDEHRSGKHSQEAWAINPDYAFRLLRKPATDHWVVKRLVKRQGARGSASLPGDFAFFFEEDERLALSINGTQLMTMIHDPSFRTTGTTVVEEGGDQLARVEFIYEPTDRQETTRGGWVLLDPAHDWVVRQFEVGAVFSNGPGTIRGNYDYEIRQDGLPLLKRMVKRQGDVDGPPVFEVCLDLKSYERRVAPADFTLSAFGLPEPNSRLRVNWLVWLDVPIVAALTLFCAAQFISRRRRYSSQG
jgi:hypothetical protein